MLPVSHPGRWGRLILAESLAWPRWPLTRVCCSLAGPLQAWLSSRHSVLPLRPPRSPQPRGSPHTPCPGRLSRGLCGHRGACFPLGDRGPVCRPADCASCFRQTCPPSSVVAQKPARRFDVSSPQVGTQTPRPHSHEESRAQSGDVVPLATQHTGHSQDGAGPLAQRPAASGARTVMRPRGRAPPSRSGPCGGERGTGFRREPAAASSLAQPPGRPVPPPTCVLRSRPREAAEQLRADLGRSAAGGTERGRNRTVTLIVGLRAAAVGAPGPAPPPAPGEGHPCGAGIRRPPCGQHTPSRDVPSAQLSSSDWGSRAASAPGASGLGTSR